MIHTRTVQEKIKIKTLFKHLNVGENPNDHVNPEFNLRVETPAGFKKIATAFRTDTVDSITCYFRNGSTVECSTEHKFMTNEEWVNASEIREDHIIETDTGTTTLKKIKTNGKRVLYDISVEDVHCYYSSGILSHNSWWLCALGAYAMKNGKNILHYTLELSDVYVGRRYDCILSNISIDDIEKYQDLVKSRLESIAGKLIVKRYFPGAVSTMGLRAHIDKCIRAGIKPDMILVDYGDLMSLQPYSGEHRHRLERLYEDLKALGGEYECPVWTLSQLNRSASNEDFIDAFAASAEAASKNNTPDFIMTFSRPDRVREVNGLYAYVSGNRYGEDKVRLIGRMDTTVGSIELYREDTQEALDILRNLPDREERSRNFINDSYTTLTSTIPALSTINVNSSNNLG